MIDAVGTKRINEWFGFKITVFNLQQKIRVAKSFNFRLNYQALHKATGRETRLIVKCLRGNW